jgi:purine-binding chemotaxis protein CheW
MADMDLDVLEIEEEGSEDTMLNKYLVFFLDNQEFAIAIEHVIDIINVSPLTKVPNVPDYVVGITNLRGKVIPIVDVRLRFGKMSVDFNERTCIIVVEYNSVPVGLIIDQVSEVITLDDDDIAPPPSFSQTLDTRFIAGIGKTETGIKLILDCRNLLYDDMFDFTEEVE